jgi:hypothetical protein
VDGQVGPAWAAAVVLAAAVAATLVAVGLRLAYRDPRKKGP